MVTAGDDKKLFGCKILSFLKFLKMMWKFGKLLQGKNEFSI